MAHQVICSSPDLPIPAEKLPKGPPPSAPLWSKYSQPSTVLGQGTEMKQCYWQWWLGLLSVGRREASALILWSYIMLKLLTLGSHFLPSRNWQDNTLWGFKCFLKGGHLFHTNGAVFLCCWTFHWQGPTPVSGQTPNSSHSSASNIEMMHKWFRQ